MNCQKLIFFGFYEKIFFIQGVSSLFRYLCLYLLLSVSLGLFAYCVPSLHTVQLGSEGAGGEGDPGEHDDYTEGQDPADFECDQENETDCGDDGYVDEMDMPYDILIDTASYLTCDSRNLPDDTFAFKMEALREGGVRLRMKFGQMDEDKIKQHPYSRSYPALIPIRPQWWVHPSSEVQFPVKGRFGSMPSIELADYLDTFLEKGEDFTNSFGRDHIQLGWQANLNLGYSLQNLFEISYLLVSFYHTSRGSSLLGYRDLDNERESTHGRYYRIDLKEEELQYTLSDITERYPLGRRQQTQKENSWSCGLRFKVRRHDDHRYIDGGQPAEPGCEDNDDGSAIYRLVRQVLGEDWNIDPTPGVRCISLKSRRKSCYVHTDNVHSGSANVNSGKGRVDHSDCVRNNILRLCPHYLSICTRAKVE